MKQEIILKPINDLIPYINNPKQHPADQIDKIASSIKNYGFTVPMVVDGQNEIIMGHGRLEAAKKLGMEEVPCIVRDDLTEGQVKALRIADNKVSESEWDIELLLTEIEGLEEFTGFTLDEIGVMELDLRGENEIIEDEVPELPEEPKTKLGDLYILGRHRLLCGDSTKAEDVERLMDGQKADMVFTDPPYGVDYKGINNDGRDGLSVLLDGAFKNACFNSKSGSAVYCFHSDKCADIFHLVYRKHFYFSCEIIWDKGFTLSRGDYQSCHEPCMYGWIKDGSHVFYGDRKQTTIWNYPKETVSGHTTPKAIGFIAKALSNSSKSEDIIIDLFGGSGSTTMACEQLNRICYMMELDPKYCDVIVERWENLTGQKAELVGG